MKKIFLSAAVVFQVLAFTEQAFAGGGGCGDYCDQTKVIMNCVAESFQVTDPEKLTDKYDRLNAEALQRNLAPEFKVTFRGISKSYSHHFDPNVLFKAWVAGLYDSIFSDQLKWLDYNYTQGYKIDPVSGAFRFAGLASPGWNKAKAEFTRIDSNSATKFVLQSIETGTTLVEAELNCVQN